MIQVLFENFVMPRMGFKKYCSQHEPVFLGSWYSPSHSQSKIGYWVRSSGRGRSTEHSTPLIFVHGLGIGLPAYTRFLHKLCRIHDGPIFVVELAHVVSKLFPIYHQLLEKVPSDLEMVESLEQMLLTHCHPLSLAKTTVVGHSLGFGI